MLNTIYWVRPLTKRLPSETLYSLLEKYINFMWPVARFIRKFPKGRFINKALLIRDYSGVYPLSEELLKGWAILSSFDCLSPTYDNSQNFRDIKKWFTKAGLENIEVHYGYNDIEGRGIKRGLTEVDFWPK